MVYDSVSSTNDVAKRLCKSGDRTGLVIVARQQTRGRGRRGSLWHSPADGLWFSVIIPPEKSIDLLGIYSLAAGHSVARAIETSTGTTVDLKWPNDVMMNGKKVCGVLIETASSENVCESMIIGIGVNVNQSRFPGFIRQQATSIAEVTGGKPDRVQLFYNILQHLEFNYFRIQKGQITDILCEWKQNCSAVNQPVTVNQAGQAVQGYFSDLDDYGKMIVTQADGGQIVISANAQVDYQEKYYASGD
jgi:BirA family biotin operon repressor/biotin-[acetyl-CoA-carboxylase] ligase